MTVPQAMTKREDYAPYHLMPEFEEGVRDYQRFIDRQCNRLHDDRYQGVAGQAYDRGAEYAMKLAGEGRKS